MPEEKQEPPDNRPRAIVCVTAIGAVTALAIMHLITGVSAVFSIVAIALKTDVGAILDVIRKGK